MAEGIEANCRFFVGGSSPHIFSLDKAMLDTGKIIGINAWPEYHYCDYWIGLDTGVNWDKFHWLPWLCVPKYMRTPNKDTEKHVPPDAADFWFNQPASRDYIPTKWEGLLRWESSTAMAAINLAIILGASEVVLYGVDFVGDDRADGHRYMAGLWEQHREPINNLLRRFQEIVPIYKLHPESWLDCPLLEVI